MVRVLLLGGLGGAWWIAFAPRHQRGSGRHASWRGEDGAQGVGNAGQHDLRRGRAVHAHLRPGRANFDIRGFDPVERDPSVLRIGQYFQEAVQMTLYVFGFVVVMALFLWLTDKTLAWLLYDLVLGWKK
jgi:hypothetical protein